MNSSHNDSFHGHHPYRTPATKSPSHGLPSLFFSLLTVHPKYLLLSILIILSSSSSFPILSCSSSPEISRPESSFLRPPTLFFSMSNSASPPQPHSPDQPYSPPITVLLAVFLLIFFFVGFFSIYFCKCFLENAVTAWNIRRSLSGSLVRTASSPINPGLDPKAIQAFPSFPYSSVKEYRREKYGLECAICLCEFTDDDMLRLLTTCYHVFHQECIDLWLESHRTCPVCRGDLDLPVDEIGKSPVFVHSSSNGSHQEQIRDAVVEDAVCITIRDDEERREEEERKYEERFSRSHSTGHSIVRSREEEEEKYRLRLPEHVRIKITRGHNSTESCITFGENCSAPKTAGGFAELSGVQNSGDKL
ncbi:RING-H2 finger protein ATL29-like [Carica papaya]|uniref:RING-H2 finger protein ATL29-like n=1 Tax=Carica papaya TaxID=3649 RepID=UPI000B8CA77C|nr:RING-H2 finger protein ATL29-like [Carica papaya]